MPEKAIGTNTLPTIRNWVVSLIPTLTSQLENDSDFITETDAETYIENTVRNAKNIWYGQCATAAGTLEKVVSTVSSSTNPFVWRKGSIIVVEFFNGVSGITQGTAVTLNVDGTGAKNVLLCGGELVYNGAWQPFETVIFAVDDTSFMMLGKVRATTSNYGVTMLSSDTNSSSQLLAATPKAVKDALSAAKTYADGIGATIPTNTSDLTNDSGFITGMTILSYGHSTWSDFISAYNANKVVYARASSNADPSSGSQTRLAFMAYVDNATNPTFVEFQYYRSVSSHSVTQQGDQVYVYTLRSSGWSVITRENYTKIAAGTNMTQSYANGTLTLNATQPSVPQATSTTPLMDGTASVGSETTWAKGDHVHPSDTSKVDKETGKGLSTNDFTMSYKDKLDGIAAGAEVNVNADWNAVSGDAEILNKPSIPTNTSDLNNDSGFITGTNITVNGDDYPIVYRGYTELSGVTGLLIHYDDGTLEGGNVFLPDGDAMNDVAQGIIAQIPTQYAGSPTAGGTANRAASIPYGEVDSTSTSTVYTATVPGITELVNGTTIMLRNAKVTSASGFTININGLGAKPCYSNMATGNPITPTAPTRETTIFNINYTMIFVYSEDLVEGGCWICYRGYDNNTNTIGYQVRTNSSTLPASDKFYRYRLLFTSADGTHFVPSNKSPSTNATTARATNTTPIDPHGSIVYYGTTAAVEANASPGAASLWQQYTLTLGYAFNTAGGALTLSYPAPVYLRCAPQTDGSAVMEDIVQALPTTDDGKIYIFLGRAYSATAIELTVNHPVYCYKNSAIRLWTGP